MVIDDVFAVIAEGTRREILRSLQGSDKAVGELVEELEVSQPTVSKHLKVLREAGLVSMRAQGQRRFYSLQTGPLEDVAEWVSAFGLGPQPAHSVEPVAPAVEAALADGALAPSVMPSAESQAASQLGRSLGQAADRAANKAADIFAHLSKPNLPNLPNLRRRRRG